MRSLVRHTVLGTTLVAVLAAPAFAQGGSLMADLMGDVSQTQKKFVDLAKAIPAGKYDWRPAAGVRSINEVLRHVASDNYLIPAALGHPADPSTGIKADDFRTAKAFEDQKTSKEQTVADLEKSFANLTASMQQTTSATLGDQVKLFGQPFTLQRAWILGTTHLHEHLGQLIAYARSNGVTPPWSQ